MGILQIDRATRAGAHLLIGLFGPPESGKTYSALMLAAGMVPDPRKRILLDTESGRGRLYSEDIPGGYDYAELTRPFTPERYVEALLEIEAAGYEVVVLDSVSHVWQGEGGVLDQADRSGKEGLQKWLKPKLAYRKLTNRLLASRMHMILCSRAKQPMIEGKDENGKKTLTVGPWIEVQDKTLRYEMTTVLEMTKRGEFVVRKCPGALDPVFRDGGTVGVEMGKRVTAWVAGGTPRDPATEALRLRADDIAAEGTEAFRKFWAEMSRDERAKIASSLDNYKSIAKAADEEAERDRLTRLDAATDLSDPFATPHDKETGEILAGTNSPASRHPADAAPTGGKRASEAGEAKPAPVRDEAFFAGDDIEIPAPHKDDKKPDWQGWGDRMVALIEAARANELDVLRSHNATSRTRCLAAADPQIVSAIDAAFAAAEGRLGG